MEQPQSCHDLAASCSHLTLHGPEQTITGLTADSRQVRPGFLFAALSGFHTSGSHFVQEALQAGAKAILHDGTLSLPAEITQLLHEEPRKALAYLASAFYGHPAEKMVMIALTGTNGKTSTAAMIEAILCQKQSGLSSGERVGVIGTTGIRYPNLSSHAETTLKNPLTTPDPVSLHRHLRTMLDNQISTVIMEVSSHALTQYRTAGIPWRVAVFTNLTRDHLDYHGTEQAYFDSKAMLFQPHKIRHRVFPRAAVIGIDTRWGETLVQKCIRHMPVFTFGMEPDQATTDFRASHLELSWQASRFRMLLPEGDVIPVSLPGVVGHFNVANALTAAATCWHLGVRGEQIAQGLQNFRPIPGRMEILQVGQPFTVVVDFAHTPDALQRLLENARMLTGQGRIITVLGCGGERDTGKRAIMGQLAARLGTETIVTDDNPRSEDPQGIRQAILAGCRLESGHAEEIPDRALAIAQALERATPGDAVLIVGKGHESVQITANGSYPFNDAQVARDYLAHRGFDLPTRHKT